MRVLMLDYEEDTTDQDEVDIESLMPEVLEAIYREELDFITFASAEYRFKRLVVKETAPKTYSIVGWEIV